MGSLGVLKNEFLNPKALKRCILRLMVLLVLVVRRIVSSAFFQNRTKVNIADSAGTGPTPSRALIEVFQRAQVVMMEMVGICPLGYATGELLITIQQQDLYVSPYHLSIAVVASPEVATILDQVPGISEEVVVKSLKDLKGSKVTTKNDDGFKFLAL
jgi:hypothetical protein